MDIKSAILDNAVVITIGGDLLIDGVAEAKPRIITTMGVSKDIRWDVSGVRTCDSAGIQLLLLAREYARARGASMQVIARSTPFETACNRIGVPFDAFNL